MYETLVVVIVGLLAIAAIQYVTHDRAFWRVAASIRRAWRGLFR